MDEDSVADAGERQPVLLLRPAAYGARIAIDLSSEWCEIEIVVEEIGRGHCAQVPVERWTLRDSYLLQGRL